MERRKNVSIKPGTTLATTQSQTLPLWVYSIALFVFAFLLYGQTIKFGFVLDDELVTYKNSYVQKGLAGIPDILSNGFLAGYSKVSDLERPQYRPVLLIQFAIENQFWGINPFVNHFFNVFYYALTGVLLFLLFRKIFNTQGGVGQGLWLIINRQSSAIAFLISMLFIAHPIHTEVVANIKSRDEIICFLFFLISLLTLFQYTINKKSQWIIISVSCFFLSVLSKESALTFLAVVPLFLFCFTNERLKKIVALTVPYLATIILFLIIRSLVVQKTLPKEIDPLYNALLAIPSLSHRLATAILVIGKYIRLLFFPHPLVWDYSINQIPEAGWLNPYVMMSVVLCLAALVFAIMKIKSRNIFAFGILYFFITLSVTSNILIYIGSTMAERFLYAPSLAFCIVLGTGVLNLTFRKTSVLKHQTQNASHWSMVPFYVIISSILVAYSYKTLARSKDWKDNITLFMAGVQDSPNSAKTHFSLGAEINHYASVSSDTVITYQLYQKAVEEFSKGLSIYEHDGETWYNLGFAYYHLKNYELAEQAYKKAVSLNPAVPNAYVSLGVIQAQKGDYKSALPYFEKALAIDSNYADVYINIAANYNMLGEYEKASIYYNKAIKINPYDENIQRNMVENERMLIGKGR